jgi:hypothetical protein
MSFVLHVWDGPTPDAVDDVQALLEAEDHGGLVPSPRFGEFAAALRKKYPDADTLEKAGRDPERSVWTDSPLDPDHSSPFFVLGLRTDTADYKLMHFIVKTAGEHGLHVYAPGSGELWRKDDPPPPAQRPKPPKLPTPEAPLMSLHRFASVPPWSPKGLPAKPTPLEGERMEVDLPEAQRIVFEPIARSLAAFGWREGKGAPGSCVLWRPHGPARQVVTIWVGDPFPNSPPSSASLLKYAVSVSFGFEIPAVQGALLGIHPRWRSKRAKVRAECGDEYADIECPLRDLFGRESLLALHYSLMSPTSVAVLMRSRRDLEWWPEVFHVWFEHQAEPLLAACTDLVTLNRFIANPLRLAVGMEQPEWNLMSTLALARLAPHPDVRWEDCLMGVRYRADRLAMDEALIERTIAGLADMPAAGAK